MTTIDGKMYVLGGTPTASSRRPIASMSTIPRPTLDAPGKSNMPLATSHSGCTVLGRTSSSPADIRSAPITADKFLDNGVWSLNVDTGVWTTLLAPAARGGGALVNLDGVLHFGAPPPADANTHWEFLPGASSWTAPRPDQSQSHGASSWRKIYAVGGQQNRTPTKSPVRLEIYDPPATVGRGLSLFGDRTSPATVLAMKCRPRRRDDLQFDGQKCPRRPAVNDCCR
jgi:hypothetical protein